MKAHYSDLLLQVPHPLPLPPSLSLSFIPLFHPPSILLLYTPHPPYSSIPSPPFIPSPSSIPAMCCPFRSTPAKFPAGSFQPATGTVEIKVDPFWTRRLLQGNFGLMTLLNLAEPFLELPCSPRLFLLLLLSCSSSSRGSDWRCV